MNRSQALSSAVPQRRAVSAWSFAMRTFHSTRTPRHVGSWETWQEKWHGRSSSRTELLLSPWSTNGAPQAARYAAGAAPHVQRVRGCSCPLTAGSDPPPPQHLGTTGWAGDKPAAFNSGFMAATDPKLTFRHYSV